MDKKIMAALLLTGALTTTALLATTTVQAQPITAGPHTRVETVYGPIEG